MSGSTEVNAPFECRLVLEYPIRFHCCPIPAKAAVVSTVLNWDIERRLLKLPGKGTGRGCMVVCELFGNVIDAYAGRESERAGRAGMELVAACGVGEKAKPGGFKD